MMQKVKVNNLGNPQNDIDILKTLISMIHKKTYNWKIFKSAINIGGATENWAIVVKQINKTYDLFETYKKNKKYNETITKLMIGHFFIDFGWQNNNIFKLEKLVRTVRFLKEKGRLMTIIELIIIAVAVCGLESDDVIITEVSTEELENYGNEIDEALSFHEYLRAENKLKELYKKIKQTAHPQQPSYYFRYIFESNIYSTLTNIKYEKLDMYDENGKGYISQQYIIRLALLANLPTVNKIVKYIFIYENESRILSNAGSIGYLGIFERYKTLQQYYNYDEVNQTAEKIIIEEIYTIMSKKRMIEISFNIDPRFRYYTLALSTKGNRADITQVARFYKINGNIVEDVINLYKIISTVNGTRTIIENKIIGGKEIIFVPIHKIDIKKRMDLARIIYLINAPAYQFAIDYYTDINLGWWKDQKYKSCVFGNLVFKGKTNYHEYWKEIEVAFDIITINLIAQVAIPTEKQRSFHNDVKFYTTEYEHQHELQAGEEHKYGERGALTTGKRVITVMSQITPMNWYI